MRSIKFRGKRVSDGKWIVGSLVNNMFVKAKDSSPCCYIINPETPEYYDCWEDIASYIDEFEVIPETVGQYTGVNSTVGGTEIYEGDLVQCWNGRENIARGSIEFSDGAFYIKNYKAQYSEWGNAENIIITGNIHD